MECCDDIYYAAKRGHLNCIKHLHENGSPWDNWVTIYAAEGDHLNCLKYCLENECPWDNLHWVDIIHEYYLIWYEATDIKILLYLYFTLPVNDDTIKYIPSEKLTTVRSYIDNWNRAIDMAKTVRSYLPNDIWNIIREQIL